MELVENKNNNNQTMQDLFKTLIGKKIICKLNAASQRTDIDNVKEAHKDFFVYNSSNYKIVVPYSEISYLMIPS